MNAKKGLFISLGIIAVLIAIGCFFGDCVANALGNNIDDMGYGLLASWPFWIGGGISSILAIFLFLRAFWRPGESKPGQGSQSELKK